MTTVQSRHLTAITNGQNGYHMRQGDTSTRDAYTIGTLPPLHLQKDNVHLLLMSLANAPAEYVHKVVEYNPSLSHNPDIVTLVDAATPSDTRPLPSSSPAHPDNPTLRLRSPSVLPARTRPASPRPFDTDRDERSSHGAPGSPQAPSMRASAQPPDQTLIENVNTSALSTYTAQTQQVSPALAGSPYSILKSVM